MDVAIAVLNQFHVCDDPYAPHIALNFRICHLCVLHFVVS